MQSVDIDMLEHVVHNFEGDDDKCKLKEYYEEVLNIMSQHWEEITKRHKQILLGYQAQKDVEYFQDNVYANISRFYLKHRAKIENEKRIAYPDRIESSKIDDVKLNVPREGGYITMNLPKVNLEKFNGDYRNWVSFHDLFKSSVNDNASLSPAQKLQYLKLHLAGEPEHLLRNFQITDANYLSAWKILTERYDNKRVLVNTQIRVLLSQSVMKSESAQGVKNLLDTTTECLQALQNLGVETAGWDPLVVYIVVQRLAPETHQLWEQSLGRDQNLPKWADLEKFLESRFRTLEAIGIKTAYTQSRASNISNNISGTKQNAFHLATNPACESCAEQHATHKCPKLLALEISKRAEVVRSKRLCVNCLRRGHFRANCRSRHSCFICKGKHHTILHRNSFDDNPNSYNPHTSRPSHMSKNEISQDQNINNEQNAHIATQQTDCITTSQPYSTTSDFQTCHTNQTTTHVLLATVRIKIKSPNTQHERIVRALIDPGSQTSFILDSLAQDLRLRTIKVSASIHGVAQSSIGRVDKMANFIISSMNDDISLEASGLVLPKITNLLPSKLINIKEWPHLEGIELADPGFFQSSKIVLLLGADLYPQIILQGLKKGPSGAPIAQQTIFGWVLSGQILQEITNNITVSNFHILTDLETQLKRFWEIEEIQQDKILSEEEIFCEEHFKRTHKRLPTGRYEVELPLNEEKVLGNSRKIAIGRLLSIQRTFMKDEKLRESYEKCISEYLEMNHMLRVKPYYENQVTESVGSNYSYLPHHGVVKESSTTTKLRVVFDASRATSSGVSLNDKLMKGPVIQDDLAVILLRWRKHKIAFIADLEKMYRQIRVRAPYDEYQRIVWKSAPDSEIQDFKLTTVTFGTKSAPFLATRTLQQLAKDERKNYPRASEIVLNDFYVDDLLSGTHSLDEALQIQKDLMQLTSSGGFSLRKWVSNSETLLENIPKEYREIKLPLQLNAEESIRTLGVYWNPTLDTFLYSIKLSESTTNWSKRKILSDVAKLFDPLGWLAPVIIIAKIILQNLWLLGSDWDEEVPKEILTRWMQYRNSLKEVENININRWLKYNTSDDKVELHGFSDASLKAYAAVIYICVIDEKGNRHVSLLTSKSKVAPIRTISLPRLELNGALLCAKLLNYVEKSLKFEKVYVKRAWTDSQIVLCWLRAHPSKWTSFVGNRVSEIHQILGSNIWSHVPSKENPADCASRGMHPNELSNFQLWWKGPEWLSKGCEYWPQNKENKTTELEMRKSSSISNILFTSNTNDDLWYQLENKYSSLTKLIRITAYVKRFINNIRNPSDEREHQYLKATELDSSMKLWFKIIQSRHFGEEIKQLKANKSISIKSRLLQLNPFIDKYSLLRVGGRLNNSNLTYDEKHPIILPDKNNFTRLLISKTHTDTLHGGPQLMSNILFKNYWIINLRNTARHIVYKCIRCFRQRAKPQQQLMGDLPKFRVEFNRPFSHTGVDYCGPFEIKTYYAKNSRRYKSYIALFVCMVTKAIHLELVTSLTADGFLAAYKRFTSRRGICQQIYCDCGSNFVAADKILRKQHKQMIQQLNSEIAALCEGQGVKFNFIPPGSPHFGGLWESGVRSTKMHLKKLLTNTTLTYEELSTMITQVEACLNSRPLYSRSSDPQDLNALTPGHFLVGDILLTPPEPSLLDIKHNYLSR